MQTAAKSFDAKDDSSKKNKPQWLQILKSISLLFIAENWSTASHIQPPCQTNM